MNELVSSNARGGLGLGPSESSINTNIKYDIFKLINKNEHLFIKYAEKKLVENKMYVIERAEKLKKAS